MAPRWSQETYLRALRFAAARHRGQTMPGDEGLCYVVHLSAVCMEVIAALRSEPAADPDLAVQCALLHDVVEDTETTLEEVSERFGPAVAAGVDALTKRSAIGDKAARMADSLARIRAQPREVWMVKLADRITNLQPPPRSWPRDKRARYLEEAGVIRARLGEASPLLASRLAEKIAGYRRHVEAVEAG